jgi:hypothetical protein
MRDDSQTGDREPSSDQPDQPDVSARPDPPASSDDAAVLPAGDDTPLTDETEASNPSAGSTESVELPDLAGPVPPSPPSAFSQSIPSAEQTQPLPDEPIAPDEPDELLSRRLNRTIAGRPLIVYLVLFAAGATLLLLLVIVWISATREGDDRSQFCAPITTQEAQQVILGGQVERMIVLVDEENPLTSLTGMRLELTDESCREPQQGADARDDLYQIIGAAEFFNTFGEQRIRITYQRQEIQAALLSTSTPTPTATLPPTETPTPSQTPLVTPTETPTETQTATATTSPEPATPVPTETETRSVVLPPVEGSPVQASPEASPSRTVSPRVGLTTTP